MDALPFLGANSIRRAASFAMKSLTAPFTDELRAPAALRRSLARPSSHGIRPSVLGMGLVGGALASAASTAVLAWRGRREVGSAFAPTNATSHWLWGAPAFGAPGPSWRHTALGYAIHHGTATFWALCFARIAGRRLAQQRWPARAASAVAAAAVAGAVDYTVTPKRFRPGFEKHLSVPSMVAVYGAFAAGLAIGCALHLRARP